MPILSTPTHVPWYGARGQRLATAVLFALAVAACSRSRPSPTDKGAAQLSPAELCRQVTLRLADGGGGALKSAETDALRRCVEIETAEQQSGPDHWRCHSTCVGDARSEAALNECDSRCPLPEIKLDCESVVRVSDVTESFGGPAARLPESSVKDSFCGHAFKVNDETVVVSIAVHRSVRGLYLFTEGEPEPSVEVETARGLGDRAVRFGQVLSATGDHECGVKFAQRRVGVSMTIRPKRPGCPFDRLERLGKTVAGRLP